MSELEPQDLLRSLRTRLSEVSSVLDPKRLESEISELEQQAAEPGLWDDQAKAQRVTSALSHKKLTLSRLTELSAGLDDAEVLLELASSEEDTAAASEAAAELSKFEVLLADLETETMLSGEYDPRSAVMNIRSGAGGDDATDFAEMLMRMYLRYSESEGMKADVLDVSYAEGAGIKSCSIKF